MDHPTVARPIGSAYDDTLYKQTKQTTSPVLSKIHLLPTKAGTYNNIQSPCPIFKMLFLLLIFAMIFATLLTRFLTARSISINPPLLKPNLRLDFNNEFHLTIFSDLHYGENEDSFGIPQDINSTRVMNDILDYENPDFVILNGDLITGENTFLFNSTKYLDVVVKPLVEHDVKWASTYGNHDSQYNLSRPALFAEESKYTLSYTQHASGTPGITNYYIPIYPSLTHPNPETPIAILWFFDSQGGAPFQAGANSEEIPNWVTPSIVSWYTSTQKSITLQWGVLPSLAFVHIPPQAFLQMQQNVFPNAGEENARFPGLNDDVPLAAEGNGTQDIPFMQALVDTPGLHSVYSGHDHGDAWCGLWPNVTGVDVPSDSGVDGKGPFVCFCKHSGYGGYGNWNRGARNLKLSFGAGMDVESWVRMENGEIVQRVGLNETYGVDLYPLEDGQNYSI